MPRPTICLLLFVVSLLFGLSMSAKANELDLPPERICDGPPSEMMRRYLLGETEKAAENWRNEYEKPTAPEEIAAYQKRMREKVLASIGGLPFRTPLEPIIIGTVSRPGYRVEKVVFQSQPNHYVTALLFLPDAARFPPPYPGVLVPCGHSKNAKGYDAYQTAGALLALNGMAALVFDPIDQGERGQYLGPGGWPDLWGVKGHIMVGVGCVLLGQNTARFEIWDGIRAIDYLQSHSEVDPRRIGCAGCSGGGTQTAYLMALDDRIRAAAPSCYLTSFPRLLATIGPQDSEQNLFGQLTFPMDHADWIMMRAPVPTLVMASTKDFFDIGGTWNTFRYAKRLYTRMGLAANLDILESDDKHGLNLNHREGAARWMGRWLLGKDRRVVEPKIELLGEKEYQCLSNGLVMTLPGARSVYDLNEDYEKKLASLRATAWAKEDKTAMIDRVRQLAGIRELSDLPRPKIEIVQQVGAAVALPPPDPREIRDGGSTVIPTKSPRPSLLPKGEGTNSGSSLPSKGEGMNSGSNPLSKGKRTYRIEKLLIRPEPGVSLPALLFLPEKPKPNRVAIYVDQRGKSAGAAPGGPIDMLLLGGVPVLAVDLRGAGQTAPSGKGFYSEEWKNAALAYLLGRSYVGMRAEDVLVCARYAAERFASDQPESVDLIAVGNIGIPALHAAALEPQLFRSARISRSLRAWSDIIHQRISKDQMVNAVHGAMTHYDLPDLAATLGEKLTIEQPVDAMGNELESD